MAGSLKLGQLLVAQGLLHPDRLAAALAAQRESGGRLGATLVAMGAIEEDQLVRVLAEQLGVKVARIGDRTVSAEIIELVPGDLAEKYRCLPLFLRDADAGARGDALVLGMEDPSDADAIAELATRVGRRLEPVLVAPSELEGALGRYYRAPDASLPDDPRAGVAELAPLPTPAPAEHAEAMAPQLPSLEAGAEPPADVEGSWSALFDDPGLDELDLSDGDQRLAEFEKEPFAEDATPMAREESTAPLQGTPPPPTGISSERQEVMLQALAQLLVEKGLITREEFAQRLRELGSSSS